MQPITLASNMPCCSRLIHGRIGAIPKGHGSATQRGFAVLSALYRTVYIELSGSMTRAICIIGCTLFLAAVGCSGPAVQDSIVPDQNEQDEERIERSANEYTVGASRIEAPRIVSAGDSFGVRVWAHLGSNLCYKFSRFEVDWNHNVAYVRIVARGPTSRNQMCAAMPSEL